jgi:tRNA(Ile)-lysidine synthase
VDSLVLLHLLLRECDRLALHLVVAHYNHGLRAVAAEEDAAFVRTVAENLGLPVVVGSGAVLEEAQRSGRGIEDAARTMRYTFLEQVRVTSNSNRIVTGHTADDNAETILLNLVRGSGVRGLAGIPLSRDDGRIIRPLLFATREEILEFAGTQRLEWREDASNASDAHRRNIVRHDLLPTVREKLNPGIARTMMRTGELFGELDRHLTAVARAALDKVVCCHTGEEVRLSCTHLRSHPAAVQETLLRIVVQESTGRELTFDRVAALAGLLHQQPGRVAELGGSWRAVRAGDEIVIDAAQRPLPYTEFVRPGIPCGIPGGIIELVAVEYPVAVRGHGHGIEYVDADAAGSEGCIVRSWHNGDSFVPLGMSGHKNVGDLLSEAGVPALRKAGHPLLTTRDGDIIWVCGIRLGERYKVHEGTCRVFKLIYQRSAEELHGEATEDQW